MKYIFVVVSFVFIIIAVNVKEPIVCGVGIILSAIFYVTWWLCEKIDELSDRIKKLEK